ncbi:iron-sulfur cluster assembly scaffold protein NifU [Citricoccus zhacaiensis]|uniref:Iron-sulfur cluster assembly scaffold protein NifU n=1 Tax=Citricoccus zhacaiensis TaxID=489142 RepID=A0ABQ2LX30_9MICC|nr:SUF system NifU family Fe-S cluster assembly protein [Citricoccus zhacaiensis]GGO44254.1 iron-sulfur cluster assembly scaffold protein NifU [Citricoccus zhacaiensis]
MSSSELQNLYQQVILDYSKNPYGVGLLGRAAGQSHQLNPTCGDEITLEVHLSGEGADRVVERIRWEGHGCAISQASASLLTELAEGLTVEDLRTRIDAFRTAMQSRGKIAPDEELLGDAVALGGVSRYVARVKCAMLGWVAAEHALVEAETR